jgi:hypothetical protein
MHGICKHYTASCCCNICWILCAQCPDSTEHFEAVERLLLRGEGHFQEEEDFSDYVSKNEFLTMDKPNKRFKEMGNICDSTKQDDNFTTKKIHSNRKNIINRHGRKIKRVTEKNSTHSHDRKRPRTDEHIHKSPTDTSEYTGHLSDSNFLDEHMQQKDSTGIIPQHHNNTEFGLQHTNLSGTDGGEFLPRDGDTYVRTNDDRIIGNEFRERETLLTSHPLPPLKSLPFHPLLTHTRHKKHPLSLSFSTKRVLSPSPSPVQKRTNPCYLRPRRPYPLPLYHDTHKQPLPNSYNNPYFPCGNNRKYCRAHTTLQRVRYINRFISYLIPYGISSFNKYGSRLLKPLKLITNSLSNTNPNKDSSVDKTDFSNCQMYTDHKKNESTIFLPTTNKYN